MSSAEIIAAAGNVAVAQRSDRSFPGILVQGDTMKILLDDLEDACQALSREMTPESDSLEVLLEVKGRLREMLVFYEAALVERGIALPYSSRSR